MGHSAQFGSRHPAGARRSHTVPIAHVDVVLAAQPVEATAQVCRLLADRHTVPIAHAFVQHPADPASPLHAPFTHVTAESS